VAMDLGLSKPTVLKLMRSGKIPGAERMYTDEIGREHWRVDRQTYERWRGALRDLQSCTVDP
jgi:hypothetical protein